MQLRLTHACTKASQDELHARLRLIFDDADLHTARQLLDAILADYEARTPKDMERLDAGFEDAMPPPACPSSTGGACAPPTAWSG